MSNKGHISFRKVLEQHAINTLKEDVDKQMEKLEETVEGTNEAFLSFLQNERTHPLALYQGIDNIDDIEQLRKSLKKERYHFPDAFCLGELINKKSIPSQIYPDNSYISSVPFLIPTQRSGLALLMNPKYKDEIISVLEQTVVNMILNLPDGLVKLTVIDKTGSGQNLPIMSLFNEKFIEGKILSEDVEIEKEMEAIKSSMGTIAQAISNSGFRTIEEYNLLTDEIPQRYNFVVINDFPSGFNKAASDNLFSLIESGFRSGIYVFMTTKFEKAQGLAMSINGSHQLGTFLKHMTSLEFPDRQHSYLHEGLIPRNIEVVKCPIVHEDEYRAMVNSRFKIKLFREHPGVMEAKVKYLNKKISSINLQPVIPLMKIVPPEDVWYSKDASKGISVPFGKKGIENINFSLGVNKHGETENVHHGMICGMTGSGKTVMIHDIIMMSSIYYSPKDLVFWLLDYKEGTEFALYKDFPQVQILSMESEIEFGHDVLQKAIDVIAERGKLFKKVGAQNLASYNEKVDEDERLPRIILIIDEFQELLRGDQRSQAKTNSLFDDILRRGRSFGVNLVLSTQTLLGVELNRSILSNMPLRIGLKMEEKDAAKVFSEDNNAVKFLEHPGQGIYNNSSGLPKANVAFQACFIDDNMLADLQKKVYEHMQVALGLRFVEELEDQKFVFYGSIKGNYENNPEKDAETDKIFYGEPLGLSKEHNSFVVQPTFGENIIMVGGALDQMITTMVYIIRQLAQKYHAKIYFANFATRLHKVFDEELSPVKDSITKFDNESTISVIEEVYEIYQKRKSGEDPDRTPVFVVMAMVENSRFLSEKRTDGRKKFEEMISSASEYGIHFLITAMETSTLRDNELMSQISKFKKRFAFRGGSSLKLLTQDKSPRFSDNKIVAIFENGHEDLIRFKTYHKESITKSLEEKN